MSRIGRLLVGLLVVLGLVVAGCGGDDGGGGDSSSGGSASADEQIAVTLLATGYEHSYVQAYLDAAREEAERLNIDLTTLDGKFTADVQAQQMTSVIANEPDGLVVWPADGKAIATSLAKAHQAGIPTVVTNADVDEAAQEYRAAYTGPNNYDQGVEQAKMIDEALGGKGKIVVIESFPGSAAHVDRLAGLEDQLEEMGSEIEIVGKQPADGDKAKAISVTNDFITRFGKQGIDGIIGQDDNMAVGAAEAARDAGMEIPVIGNGAQKDALAGVKSGLLYGTLEQSPVEDAKLAINAINSLVREGSAETVYLEPVHITKENADEFTAEW